MERDGQKLRKERSINSSGSLNSLGKIKLLKDKDYRVLDINLDGDAPKQFIKAYFYTPFSSVRKSNPQSWIPYIAKTAEKWYPHESVIEFMINRIGVELGLKMNEIKLVRANGQIRFLSRYFLKPGEALIHGAEICGQYLDDIDFASAIANDKRDARELFTFEFIEKAIRSVFPESSETILADLVRMIVFDAVVGNNDRHFYNWAVIRSKKRSNPSPSLAPIYDSSRGLLWNLSDSKIVSSYQNVKNGGKFVDNYVKNAYPRISVENDSNADHFQLLSFLKRERPLYRDIIEGLTSPSAENKAVDVAKREFSHFFIAERNRLTVDILQERFRKARLT